MDSTEVLWLPTATGPLPVAAQINGRLYAIDADHLNTPRRLTNAQGQVVWQWLIAGFGEANPTTGATGYAQEGAASGRSYGEQVRFDLRYPGQVWDEETGLSYNLHRYYDVGTGRYVQADPIGLEGGWNRFGYVDGNPVSYVDPEGLETVYNLGPITFVAYPGPPATDFRAEHGSKTGAGHHVHTFMNGREGPRILTGTFQVYPGDEKLCTGPFKDALTKLNEGEKQYIKRAQMQVFNDGKLGSRLQNVRARTMLPRLMGGGFVRGRE